jgi:hypothetical protein
MVAHWRVPVKKEKTMTIQEKIQKLRAHRSSFAQSLVQQFLTRGSLTERQLPYVDKLLAEMDQPREAPPPSASVGSLAPVLVMFKIAAQHLKFPKVRLATEDGTPVVLSLAGANSKNAGMVYVKLDGMYAGKVDHQGNVWKSGDITGQEWEQTVKVLTELASHPAQAAKAYGQRTGNCCFCGTEITTKESLAVGYGPICAEHYGLPWGDTN